MASIPAYFTQGELTLEKRQWLERQANGLQEGIQDAFRRIRVEEVNIQRFLEERNEIISFLKGVQS